MMGREYGYRPKEEIGTGERSWAMSKIKRTLDQGLKGGDRV